MTGKRKYTTKKNNTDYWPPGKPIPQERKDRMFDYWCEIKSLPQVEKKFGHCHSTLTKIKKDDNWEKRYSDIQVNLQRKHDKRIEQGLSSNLDRVVKIRDKIYNAIMAKKDKDLFITIRDLVMIMEYEDKLLGNMPENNRPSGSIINVFTNMREKEQDDALDDTETILTALRNKNRFGIAGNVSVDLPSS